MSNNKKRDDDKWADLEPGHDKWTHHKPWHDKPWHDKPGHNKPGDDDSDDVGFGDGKTVVLTFDDGPAPIGALKDILKTLHHEDIKAEFFVIGSEVEENPRKTKMIVREGHDIQNHSWSHVNLATASEEDRTARIWELEGQREVALVTLNEPVKGIGFSPDGRRFVTGESNGTARVWLWHPEDLIEAACGRLTVELTADEWRRSLPYEPRRQPCRAVQTSDRHRP